MDGERLGDDMMMVDGNDVVLNLNFSKGEKEKKKKRKGEGKKLAEK